jgi:hypothetical protein
MGNFTDNVESTSTVIEPRPPGRSLDFRGNSYPVVLPSVRDPRLHLAAVIITIHFLGQGPLGFKVSIPQILCAIVTCALMEVGITFAKVKQIVWPASAMLTGSGVALILRAVGTDRADVWSWHGWYYFAGIAALSLATKYLIKHRGTHVFNPSNVGLVIAFLVLGSSRIEPLDFWWHPLDPWMLLAYLVILVGGVLITRRLHLLALAVTFWLALGAGLGVVAASGHCITASWSLTPVCDARFWSIVMTSPEILIFLFFMITDPKTIPHGRSARLLFAVGIALASTLLMAPQTTEFGAKVGLLAGLVLLTPMRWAFDRLLSREPERGVWARLISGGESTAAPGLVFARGAVVGGVAILLATAVVMAGAPARVPAQAADLIAEPPPTVQVDPASLPVVTADLEVASLNAEVDLDDLAVTLAENLEIEAIAVGDRDSRLLPAADGGRRLAQMVRRVDDAVATGVVSVPAYRFDSLHAVVIPAVGGQQATIGLQATGTTEWVNYDASGQEQDRIVEQLASTFVLSPVVGERWLIIEERIGG